MLDMLTETLYSIASTRSKIYVWPVIIGSDIRHVFHLILGYQSLVSHTTYLLHHMLLLQLFLLSSYLLPPISSILLFIYLLFLLSYYLFTSTFLSIFLFPLTSCFIVTFLCSCVLLPNCFNFF